ncbi:MAG TPA: hypothetical protein VGQ46_18220 [Thermoanaerobaculia bacterium]|jgi:hypothetical protein|nr:hypothetical protein [Thermoanaerobaculia bacterium]
MDTRQTLHELVDQLPDEDLITAVRVLKGLELVPDDLTVLLENAPIDDEPDDDDFDGGLTEALAETELIPHEEVKRRYLK